MSNREIEDGLQFSEFKKFSKGNYILRAGEYCGFIGFLNKGLIATTVVDDSGDEKAHEFKCVGCFLPIPKASRKTASLIKNFIALEDCEA